MLDKNTQILVVIVAVIILVWWVNQSSNNEAFNDNTILPNNPLVPQFTGPTHYDPQTGTMMTSPDFIPQNIESAWEHVEPAWSTSPSSEHQKSDFDKIGAFDSATDLGKNTMAFNMCSKSCCSKQYPLPFKMPVNPEVAENIKDFVPSRFTCNNYWEDAGCLCITKDQSDNLAQRGGNV
jgi:hypothetical protein